MYSTSQVGFAKEGNLSITSSRLLATFTTTPPTVPGAGDYDPAGFADGAVERPQLLPRDDIVQGDVYCTRPAFNRSELEWLLPRTCCSRLTHRHILRRTVSMGRAHHARHGVSEQKLSASKWQQSK